jgi:ABC-2 type transport system ATP-binding protein
LTREIGGDVILFEARDPQGLADRIRDRFQVDTKVMDKQVRVEIENGHRFVPDVVEAFPGEIQSLSVSKPTLEDVFIHRTGHRFWSEDTMPSAKTVKKKKR